MSRGLGTPPSFLPAMPALVSSRMISLHSSTHSSQMNTVGPAMSLRTSCCDLPQKLQYNVLFASEPVSFVILYPIRPQIHQNAGADSPSLNRRAQLSILPHSTRSLRWV